MANLKEIKRRIGSVKKTRQITSAMKLVAGAKLRKATEAATRAKPYQEHLAQVLGRVAGAAEDLDEPLLKTPESVNRVLLVVLSTDRGLCGGFNNVLLRRTRD
jgi:F-type H+-transporting ATPase subunit gamma